MSKQAGVIGVAALAAVALLVVAMHSQALRSTTLYQTGSLADQIDNGVMAKVQADQLAQDRQTVRDAGAVNARFGGRFSQGVGSNTWAGTPWGKYDDKDARTESLAEEGVKHVARHVAHAKHVMHKAKRGKPSWLNEFDAATFHGTEPRRDVVGAASTEQKVTFWEGIGDKKDVAKQAPSSGRSTRPISMAKKAPLMMLHQDYQEINAQPYYLPDLGAQQQQLAANNGGNPYAEGWAKLKPAKSLPELYSQISDQLQPLAQEYPYLRAIRH